MSRWADFGLYALQAVVLWIIMPRWVAWFMRPLLERPGIRVRLLQAWGALSVLALWRAPDPALLLRTSNLTLAVGLLLAAVAAWTFLRSRTMESASRAATDAEPRLLRRDDFLPRRLQYGVYGLVLVAFAARCLAGLAWPQRVHDIWGTSLMGLVIALLLFFVAAGSVMRAPNLLDRALGPKYRQMEVRGCHLLMACLALLQLAGLVLELHDGASRRGIGLLMAGFVSATFIGFMLVPTRTAEQQWP